MAISRSHPSIPAKFSKYTKGKHPYSAQSRSESVRQQQAESQAELQPYFKQKSVFFQDFEPEVIKPDQPCQFSYSEHPKVAPIGLREPVYSPFGPESLPRPWTGKRPDEPSKRAPRQFDSFMLPPSAMTKVRHSRQFCICQFLLFDCLPISSIGMFASPFYSIVCQSLLFDCLPIPAIHQMFAIANAFR